MTTFTRTWVSVPALRTRTSSPIGFELIDDVIAAPAALPLRMHLEKLESGAWLRSDIKPVRTLSGYYVFPALGKSAALSAPTTRWRTRVESDYYIPLYRETVDGHEFDAIAYTDRTPTNAPTQGLTVLHLAPGSAYPFDPVLAVLRGSVKDASNNPVADALVTQGLKHVTITDAAGVFALPLRWASGLTLQIDAAHSRTGRTGLTVVLNPSQLDQFQTIIVT